MQITVSKVQGSVSITILHPFGALDASNYHELVNKAHEAYDAGSRYIIVDLSDTPYMSSSGIVALHSIALLLHDDALDERSSTPENKTWEETDLQLKSIDLKRRVKLVSPPPRVDQLLEMAGFKRFIETYASLDAAILAFSAE